LHLPKQLMALALLTGGLLLGATGTVTASAKYQGHSATPTELRGTWYQYQGKHKWLKVKITKHAFNWNNQLRYTPQKKSWHQLYVKRYKKNQDAYGGLKGYGGTNYIFNGKFKYEYQHLGAFWLSKQRVKGQRVMKSYYNMFDFKVYTKKKIAHNYSYQYKGKQYMNRIGR